MITTPSSRLVHVDRSDLVDQLIAASFARPVLLFKHSPSCGTSFFALDEVEAYRHGEGAADVYLVDVIGQRALSRDVAQRLGVRHQSPQVLLIVDGEVRWHASHYGVTRDAMTRALAQVAPVASS